MIIICGEKEMPSPDLEPQGTFFIAKWTMEIVGGLIVLLVGAFLKMKGKNAKLITKDKLEIQILKLRQEMLREINNALSEQEENIIKRVKDLLEAKEK